MTALTLGAQAQCASPMGVRFHNETADTAAITQMLIETQGTTPSKGATMVEIATRFEGRPYVSGTLEGDPEMLTVNIDEFDCMTFVETVAAMTMTLDEHRTSWIDFIYNLEQLRYRGGRAGDYASRLHYFSDWVVDNTHRGNLREVSDRIGPKAYAVKTLDFMSSNADKYPALKDKAAVAAIRNTEIGYRMHRFPYIKTTDISKAQLRDGDIIAITTSIKNLDVTHTGIVKMMDGVPHLIHASSKAGKVVLDATPLQDYVRHNRTATGIRVVRLAD